MHSLQSFDQFITERAMIQRLVAILHEGIQVVPFEQVLNEKSNSESFAKRELERVVKAARNKGDRAIVEPFVPEILALIDKFGNSGQSGGSAPYTAGAIVGALKKLLMFEPISPVTNEDDDWHDLTGDGTFQNKRCSALFKEGKDGRPYYLDAIVWKTPKGATFTGSATTTGNDRVYSRQYVKKFPFEPKTFTVDVDEEEVKPDDWEFYVKNTDQLDEVFDYYDEYKDDKKKNKK